MNVAHGGTLMGLKELLKRMQQPENSVLVGVPAGAEHVDETTGEKATMAKIAAIHEFGADNIPERPVLRQGTRNGMKKLQRVTEAHLRAVLQGKMTLIQVVQRTGVLIVGEVKREFTSPAPAFVPNAPATIARKGSSRPLVDTGQFRQSITYSTEDKAGGGNARVVDAR